jgi:hypothetical protein
MLRGATTSDLKIVASWISNGVDRRLAVRSSRGGARLI